MGQTEGIKWWTDEVRQEDEMEGDCREPQVGYDSESDQNQGTVQSGVCVCVCELQLCLQSELCSHCKNVCMMHRKQ